MICKNNNNAILDLSGISIDYMYIGDCTVSSGESFVILRGSKSEVSFLVKYVFWVYFSSVPG